MSYIFFVIAITFLTSTTELILGTLAVNDTNEADAEGQQQQPWLNSTDAQTPESEATEAEAAEVEAEEEATEGEEAKTSGTEATTAEEGVTGPAPTPAAHNATRTQALQRWGAHLLASKYMGSLAVLYLALCLFLAIKNNMLFVR